MHYSLVLSHVIFANFFSMFMKIKIVPLTAKISRQKLLLYLNLNLKLKSKAINLIYYCTEVDIKPK